MTWEWTNSMGEDHRFNGSNDGSERRYDWTIAPGQVTLACLMAENRSGRS